MKTKFYWLALLASAAMVAQANAGGHHGGGGGGGGSFSSPFGRSGGSSFHPAAGGSFGGGRMIYSGQRFSGSVPHTARSTMSYSGVRNTNARTSIRPHQLATARSDRSDNIARATNGNRVVANSQRHQANGANQIRNGNATLRADWQKHVFARRSAGWQRNWDRRHDHWWNGHRCHFVNGCWVIFDSGFDPWWPYWYDDYFPYPYNAYPYAYGYAPDYYDSSVYPSQTYDANGYGAVDQYVDPTVAAVQERLERDGYYHGDIDGVLGPETRNALARYQSDHSLRVTGGLTSDTLRALGLPRVAANE
jgi:hypothetical protein